jgi:hypothetical protein
VLAASPALVGKSAYLCSPEELLQMAEQAEAQGFTDDAAIFRKIAACKTLKDDSDFCLAVTNPAGFRKSLGLGN